MAQAAPDPIRIATGARTLGMGKSFVGLADDISAIFLNPAGLAKADNWQLTSMSGKLLEEFNYVSVSGLYPTNFGNFGLGFIRSDIGGAFPTTIEAGSDPDNPIFIIDTTQDAMTYYNNLFILSYSDNLKRLFSLPGLSVLGNRFPSLSDINVGINTKLFAVNLTGDHISQGNAYGREIDLGIQGQTLPWLSLGANAQNILPATMGGKLQYDSGWEENYPAVLKLGSAINAIGENNSLYKIQKHNVKLLADIDYELSRSNDLPPLMHLGLEWKPMALIALRAGIDQEIDGPNSVANNMTSGIGLYYGEFRFDYAFHQFAGAPGVDNHFFSFSYGANQLDPIVNPIELNLSSATTYDQNITLKGSATDPKIALIKINNEKVNLSPRGDFVIDISLKIGVNPIMVEGFAFDGKLIKQKKITIIRLTDYPDIPQNYWAYEQINHLATLGLISGYPDGKFRPEGSINRAELCALLIRAKLDGTENIPIVTAQEFEDVPLDHWASKYINLAIGYGIAKGYPDNTFKPTVDVNRAEGLAMIARFANLTELPYANQFPDIAPRFWGAQLISAAYQQGMLTFLAGKPFEPQRLLTRAEAVEMLYRTKPVANKLKSMINFEETAPK